MIENLGLVIVYTRDIFAICLDKPRPSASQKTNPTIFCHNI
jgi:hypothetical protein